MISESRGQAVLFSVKIKRNEFLRILIAIWLWKLERSSVRPVPRVKTTLPTEQKGTVYACNDYAQMYILETRFCKQKTGLGNLLLDLMALICS